ncbi:MAG: NRDE family protein [Steroidobacteraceae bacterium]
MCLLVIAWQAHARYRLVVAANRDEYHDRPSAPLGWWSGGATDVLGGRDLRAGGTWLALDAARRFGVVTNFRDLQPPLPDAPSRGRLIPDYLSQHSTARRFMEGLAAEAGRYSGFNLLLTDHDELWYASNRTRPVARVLPPGIHGLSNHLLDTPWPKLVRMRAAFGAWIATAAVAAGAGSAGAGAGAAEAAGAGAGADAGRLMTMLADRAPTQEGEGLERALSAPFVLHPLFGTRCSSVVLLEPGGALTVRERRFDADGAPSGETEITLEAGAGHFSR